MKKGKSMLKRFMTTEFEPCSNNSTFKALGAYFSDKMVAPNVRILT
jgi:hypothetical protein